MPFDDAGYEVRVGIGPDLRIAVRESLMRMTDLFRKEHDMGVIAEMADRMVMMRTCCPSPIGLPLAQNGARRF